MGGLFKNWKTRWFVLDKNGLKYFSNEDCSHDGSDPLGHIKLHRSVMTNQGFEDEQLLFKVIDQDRAEPMIVKAATPEVHEHLFYFMFILYLLSSDQGAMARCIKASCGRNGIIISKFGV